MLQQSETPMFQLAERENNEGLTKRDLDKYNESSRQSLPKQVGQKAQYLMGNHQRQRD
jgi:hypothetical protein